MDKGEREPSSPIYPFLHVSHFRSFFLFGNPLVVARVFVYTP